MTIDEIINSYPPLAFVNHSELKADLKAAAEMACIEWVARWMIERSYATGHGDTVEDLLGELEGQAKERGARRP